MNNAELQNKLVRQQKRAAKAEDAAEDAKAALLRVRKRVTKLNHMIDRALESFE